MVMMNKTLIVMATLASTFNFALVVQGEDLGDLRQLMTTKQCEGCNLTNSGLVRADLTGANLRNANLSRANLSRADLTGADLSGANLAGTSLNGTNLAGANLTGANLAGADLRDAYLMNANLLNVDLNTVYLQGAIGVPNYAGTPEQFQRWALEEANKGNYQAAANYYNQALNLDPEYAPAYLGRGVLRYQMRDLNGAMQDAQIASNLFERQEHTQGYESAQNFIKGLEVAMNPEAQGGGNSFGQILSGIGSLLLRFLF
jgi:tetratricopeptide (TPR) repeat protein